MASGLENIETIESPFRRFVTTIGVFPTAFTDAMTYYECLAYLVKYMEDTMIPAINENAEAVEELQGLYIQLKTFVDTYFDNLDVQEEINNKLDEMVEDGTMQELINNFLQPNALWTFDTVADMQASTNLVDGGFAHTLGYYSVGDGGNALYKIKSTAPTTHYETLDSGLYAQLVTDSNTNILHFGAHSDNSTDISSACSSMLAQMGYIRIPRGNFKLDNSITVTTSYNIYCDGVINYTGTGYAFVIQNANNCEYKIERINSTNGGAFDISSTDTVSFINITLNRAYVDKEVFNLNANGGIITLLKLDGVRWSSESSSPIVMYQDTNTVASSYLSEINIFNADLLSKNGKPGIKATCDHSTKSINFNLDNVDLENSWGIHTYKRIFSIGMYNCRFGEINYKQGWLTFNDYCPKMTIVGTGDIDPHYFTYNNVGTNYQYEQGILILTNVVDHISASTYNGAIITKNKMIPLAKRWVWKSITNDIDTTTNSVTLPQPSPEGNLYNNFSFVYASNLTINVPNNFADEFIISSGSSIDITVKRGNYTATFTNTPGTIYKVIDYGTGIKVLSIS